MNNSSDERKDRVEGPPCEWSPAGPTMSREWKEEEKTNSSGLVDDLFADGFNLLFIVCLERRMTQIEL